MRTTTRACVAAWLIARTVVCLNAQIVLKPAKDLLNVNCIVVEPPRLAYPTTANASNRHYTLRGLQCQVAAAVPSASTDIFCAINANGIAATIVTRPTVAATSTHPPCQYSNIVTATNLDFGTYSST